MSQQQWKLNNSNEFYFKDVDGKIRIITILLCGILKVNYFYNVISTSDCIQLYINGLSTVDFSKNNAA